MDNDWHKDLERLRKHQDTIKSIRKSNPQKQKAESKQRVNSKPQNKNVPSNPLDDGRVNPEDFIEYYADGTKLYKINSFIKALSKHVDD